MARIREPLCDQLWKAWVQTIRRDYRNQRINSEHGLQASFIVRLMPILPKSTRRIFVEPRILSKDQKTEPWIPDIVVCNTKQVIAVIEMKYVPKRLDPVWTGDLKKLNTIAGRRNNLSVANTRYLGPPAHDKAYAFSADTLFVWAGVHRPLRSDAKSLQPQGLSNGHKSLKDCFVEFHAFTHKDRHPTEVCHFG